MHWNQSCPRPKRNRKLNRTGNGLRQTPKKRPAPRNPVQELKAEAPPSHPMSPPLHPRPPASEKTTKSPKSPNWTSLQPQRPRKKKNPTKFPKRGLQVPAGVNHRRGPQPAEKSAWRSPIRHLGGTEDYLFATWTLGCIITMDLVVHPETDHPGWNLMGPIGSDLEAVHPVHPVHLVHHPRLGRGQQRRSWVNT